jgi:Uncharacterised nucleotidyltransferase
VTTDYWAAVTDLGRLSDEPAQGSAALAALERGELEPERLHAALVHSKVMRLVVRRLRDRELGPAGRWLLDLLTASDEVEARRHAAAQGLTVDVLRLVAETGSRVMKGLAARTAYPDQSVRHLGDVDVQTPDFATALDFATRLRARGWAWDAPEYPWLKWDESGVIYGQLPLVHPEPSSVVGRVDLHFGAYSVGHAGRMPLAGWDTATVMGVDVLIPNREHAIALIAAHALTDTRLSMKDVNDLHVIIGSSTVDWSTVVELCRAASAQDVLGQLLAELGAIYPGHRLPRVEHFPRLVSGGLRGADRPKHFAWHAYCDERARGATEEEAALVSKEAYRYFGADLSPRPSKNVLPGPDGTPGRNVCWRLLPPREWECLLEQTSPLTTCPQASRLADGLEVLTADGGTVVRLSGEVFVPTVWGDVHPASVRLARRVLG